jgi:hypothetical protein
MSISDEEFQRFQNQLVDLKTRNYQLEEQNKKINAGKLNKISVNHFRYFAFIYKIMSFFFYFRKCSIKKST